MGHLYSDWAIQCVLTLKVLYRLPLRATQGSVASLLELMRLELPTPSGIDSGGAAAQG